MTSPQQPEELLLIDGDGHFLEPFDLWERLLDRPFLRFAPRLDMTPDGERIVWAHHRGRRPDPRIGLGDRLTPQGVVVGNVKHRTYAESHPGGFDADERLADMDTDGVAAAVLFPTIGLAVSTVPDVDAQVALSDALNAYLAEYCAVDPARLYGVASLPFSDPQRAADTLARCVKEYGFVGGWVRGSPYPGGRSIADEAGDALWQAAQDLGVPVAIHEGADGTIPSLGTDRTDDPLAKHALAHPLEGITAFVTMYFGGVFERFRELQVGFMESGCGWLPVFADRVHEHMELFGWTRSDLTRSIDEVVRENVWIGCEGEDPFIRLNHQRFGVSKVIWASDYPHRDAQFPGVADRFLERTDLPADERADVVTNNAVAFYHLDEELIRSRRRGKATPA